MTKAGFVAALVWGVSFYGLYALFLRAAGPLPSGLLSVFIMLGALVLAFLLSVTLATAAAFAIQEYES